MPLPRATTDLYRANQRRVAALVAQVEREWTKAGRVSPRLIAAVLAAQFGAATDGAQSVPAAFRELGYDVKPMVRVYSLTDDSAAQGILQKDDVIRAANGTPITDTPALREIINAGGGAPVVLTIERNGQTLDETITPKQSTSDGDTVWLIGVSTMHDYDFPIQVTIQLDNVGGPSAGMMFALGIVDKLTPGSLNGGESVAGTGTISSTGEVGPIGGIRQKMWGAKNAGADWFLAPSSNCDEVTGHIPGGLTVLSVTTLDDAMTALAAIRGDGSTAGLPTCPTK